MRKVFILFFKAIKRVKVLLLKPVDQFMSWFAFYSNNVQFSSYSNSGWPKVSVALGGTCIIGEGFRSNNREMSNPIGRCRPCSLVVSAGAKLVIGRNVGVSSTSIVCHNRIDIGDYVKIGGNTVIYDTDFHSLASQDRLDKVLDASKTLTSPIWIGHNAFIGAHSTILKGVNIGENSVIGACSVVTKNVPANEVWAGNPARKLRSLE